MKTELFRQLLGQWVLVKNIHSDKYNLAKLEFFSNDEELIHVKYLGRTWFDWLPIKNIVLIGIEEKGSI